MLLVGIVQSAKLPPLQGTLSGKCIDFQHAIPAKLQ
jgi:hypothetical protein